MKKHNKKMEGLQSRREFFKKAAKSALPILGAIVLAGSPVLAKAVGKVPMGCNYGCSGGCDGSCTWGCKNTCRGACEGSCRGGCSGCSLSCRGGCEGTCRNSCQTRCTSMSG